MEKLCSELRKGALIAYSDPMAHLKPEVTPNLRDEVADGHTAGPFPSPLFENQQVFPAGLVPKKHSDKSFTCPSPNLGPPALNITLKRMT